MTVRYLTGDVTKIDLSEFLSIESTGPYNEVCSTCRKDEDLGIVQTILSCIVLTIAGGSMAHFFAMSLESVTLLSIVGTIITGSIMMTAFWFFMPRDGGDHRYIRAWSKLPFIGPRLKRSVALAKIAHKEVVAARIATYM